ncbi:MAG TPA: YbaN family protein [Spirochaetota bacterium]|nr:YbaN family protein [Spirochaetota bacterium]HPV41889.1 YbaN family protein [Spirochaetota bacterium]
MRDYVFIFLGALSLLVGLAGILVPVLPTTPFVLLAAALFVRSSDRLYRWLVSSRLFGGRIRKFREQGGMTMREKASAIALMWAMIGLSSLLVGFNMYVIALGAAGAVVMGFVIRTAGPVG